MHLVNTYMRSLRFENSSVEGTAASSKDIGMKVLC